MGPKRVDLRGLREWPGGGWTKWWGGIEGIV